MGKTSRKSRVVAETAAAPAATAAEPARGGAGRGAGLPGPWVTYARKLEALFGGDPGVEVAALLDGGDKRVVVRVTGERKATALRALLPATVDFGSVSLAVDVEAAPEALGPEALLAAAFDGNPALAEVRRAGPGPFEATYAVFRARVVQFPDDRLDDPEGLASTLYQNLALELLRGAPPGVFFATERAPAGEQARF